MDNRFSRRDFLKLSALALGSLLLPPAVRTDKPRLRDLAAKLKMDVGGSLSIVDRWELYEYPQYVDSILEFSVIRDGMASWPSAWMETVETYEYLTQMGLFAKKNDMRFSLDNLFHSFLSGDPKVDYLKTAGRKAMEEWMRERARKFFALPYFTDVQFANEAMTANEQEPLYWNSGAMYNAFGKEWVEVAYHLVAEEAEKTGRVIGKDFQMVYHTAGQIEVPNSEHANAEYEFLTDLKTKLSDRYGLERPFVIGMEYHIHIKSFAVANGCGGPGSYQLKKNELIEHFQRFDEIGNVYINELSIGGSEDANAKKEVLHSVLEAAIESKACGRFFFWTPFLRLTGNAAEDALQLSCTTQNMFDKNFRPDYMFDEMYTIFESYANAL